MNKFSFPLAVCALVAGSLLFAATSTGIAGTEERVNKEVTAQAAKEPFPVHFSLSAGVDSDFIFRGVNILPEQRLDLQKASDIAINNLPDFRNFLLKAGFPTVDSFVKLLNFPRRERVARSSGIGYFDGAVSAYGFTAGAFYALQDVSRTAPGNLGGQSFFDEYRELDLFLTYQHSLGPVTLTLGGTYYHVSKNSQFDTAEMNFGVLYSPPQFRYVNVSFSYDYAGGFNAPVYIDGHHLELRVSGDVPLYRKSVKFSPYILVSAGSGIVPRAFNRLSLPTYFSSKLYANSLQPAFANVFNSIINGGGSVAGVSGNAISSNGKFVDPTLDRNFDLSNAQIGFKVPIYLTRYVTLTGDFNYSRPLGNLQGDPYNQKDVVYGGANLNISY